MTRPTDAEALAEAIAKTKRDYRLGCVLKLFVAGFLLLAIATGFLTPVAASELWKHEDGTLWPYPADPTARWAASKALRADIGARTYKAGKIRATRRLQSYAAEAAGSRECDARTYGVMTEYAQARRAFIRRHTRRRRANLRATSRAVALQNERAKIECKSATT
jgi:hypothetical protein